MTMPPEDDAMAAPKGKEMSATGVVPLRNAEGDLLRGKRPGTEYKKPQTIRRASISPYLIRPRNVFLIFAAVNLLAAYYSPIHDCDEVFNFWEPLHYLLHGFGLQTWEYSPEYNIRSWLYIFLHAGPGTIVNAFKFVGLSKVSEFYFTRMALGIICAFCQSRLYSSLCRILNPRIGVMFGLITIFGPGMFHASVAFLPSSFTMYTTTLGVAAAMDWHGGLKIGDYMMWFGIGAVSGWPFSLALILPFVVEDFVLAQLLNKKDDYIWAMLDGAVRTTIWALFEVFIDWFFYHTISLVPWNIIHYNIFGGSSKGPNIFGTEPWDFYFRNLSLNFNLWFALALLALPIALIQLFFRARSTTSQNTFRILVFITPFYLWLAIFTLQPHKEERFMYPAYPLLAVNAAITLHGLLSFFGSTNPKSLMGVIPPQLKLAFVGFWILLAIALGIFRTAGVVMAYSAPLEIYKPLQNPDLAHSYDAVCLGKEWYRFPSSFFVPQNMRARFIKSEFNGLLPGQFHEGKTGFGFFSGTWLIPPGMNDRNIEDPGKHVDIKHCSYLVDSYFPGTNSSALEPHYILDTSIWEQLQCADFLDTSKTHILGRIFWIPSFDIIPEKYQRKWGRQCLLRRRSLS